MENLLALTKSLTTIPSPTGYTTEIMSFLEEKLGKIGYDFGCNHRGDWWQRCVSKTKPRMTR